jgi:TPR repeat protein
VLRNPLLISYRAATLIAVVGGALFGAAAAIMTGDGSGRTAPSPPSAAQEPFRPLAAGPRRSVETSPRTGRAAIPSAASVAAAQAAPDAASAAAASPATSAAAATPATRSPVWGSAPLEAGADQVEQARLGCGRGDAAACMRVGVAYLHGRGVSPDSKQARLFLGQGRKLYTKACQRRDPAACLALAQMYAGSVGVEPNQRNFDALMKRVRMLCRMTPVAVCKQID